MKKKRKKIIQITEKNICAFKCVGCVRISVIFIKDNRRQKKNSYIVCCYLLKNDIKKNI